MNYFVNEYQYTDEIISECTTAQVRRRSVVLYIAIALFILYAFLLIILPYIYIGEFIYMGLSYDEMMAILIPVMLIWLCIRRRKRAIKMSQERIRVLFKDTIPVYRIEIGEDIHATSSRSESNISFSDVVKMFETENLIILMIRGNLTIILDKRGFIQGDADGCKQYLKERISPYTNRKNFSGK